MIPFHKIYSWLFKSFKISWETELIDKLISEWYSKMMIVKRSWIYALFILWIPVLILILSWASMYVAHMSVQIAYIQYMIIGGNLLMSIILVVSSWNYIRHFREIQSTAVITDNPEQLRNDLNLWDQYFISFFNASITNQFILFITIIGEIFLVILFQKQLGNHFWILTLDTVIMISEIVFLKMYRKRMMDLEMDYNVIVPGKIFFVNQSWVLSSIQTIESSKIKTVRSSFPSKISSFFNYGNVDVLTEGDSQAMLWTMSMYYVTDPDGVVTNIQSLLDEEQAGTRQEKTRAPIAPTRMSPTREELKNIGVKEHSYDTRSKIRDVLQ